MLGEKFLERVGESVGRVGLKLRRLDVIDFRYFFCGDFARDGRDARAGDGGFERPSGLRGDGLPGGDRLPGDAVQFAFTLLDYYQDVVRHKLSSFVETRLAASCCARSGYCSRPPLTRLPLPRRGKPVSTWIWLFYSTLTSFFSFSTSFLATSAGGLPRIRCFLTSPAGRAFRFSADSGSGLPGPRPSSLCAGFVLGLLDPNQRRIAQLVDAGLNRQHGRQRHIDELEESGFQLALHADAAFILFDLHDDGGVRPAKNFSQNYASLCESVIVGLQAGKDEVELFVFDGGGNGPRGVVGIKADKAIALEMDGASRRPWRGLRAKPAARAPGRR